MNISIGVRLFDSSKHWFTELYHENVILWFAILFPILHLKLSACLIVCFCTISYIEIEMQTLRVSLFDHFYSYLNFSVGKSLLRKLISGTWNKPLFFEIVQLHTYYITYIICRYESNLFIHKLPKCSHLNTDYRLIWPSLKSFSSD